MGGIRDMTLSGHGVSFKADKNVLYLVIWLYDSVNVLKAMKLYTVHG